LEISDYSFSGSAPVWQKGANSSRGDSGATICERQDTGESAEVPSRDGAGAATVILAAGEDKKELFAVKGLKRHQPLAEAVAGACAIAGFSPGQNGTGERGVPSVSGRGKPCRQTGARPDFVTV